MMKIKLQMFSEMCINIAFKLSLEYDVLTDFSLC
jgi:hypothetical protein